MKMSLEKKIERFNEKYKDKGGFDKFMELVNDLATLDKIGKYFGFSRQNAAGLYKSFFNKKYGEIQRKRRIKKHKEMLETCCDLDEIKSQLVAQGKKRSARKVGYIKLVKRIAESLKYDVLIRQKRSGALEIFINGYKCSVSGSSTQTIYHYPQNHPPSVYYRFAVPTRAVDYCIFLLELEDHFTFYIIPYDKIKHLTLITLKDKYEREKGRRGNTSSKYAAYQNRWELLKKPHPHPQYKRELDELIKDVERA